MIFFKFQYLFYFYYYTYNFFVITVMFLIVNFVSDLTSHILYIKKK